MSSDELPGATSAERAKLSVLDVVREKPAKASAVISKAHQKAPDVPEGRIRAAIWYLVGTGDVVRDWQGTLSARPAEGRMRRTAGKSAARRSAASG
jgi:hypothetical protein